jgi:uncharacterized protein YggU (UPF0235/DUF167 family)
MTARLAASSDPWRLTETGITLSIRVTPRGGHDCIDGVRVLADGRALLTVRVRAIAEDGAANQAVTFLLAKALGIAKRDLQILSGHTGRVKQIGIVGDAAVLTMRLHELIRSPGDG